MKKITSVKLWVYAVFSLLFAVIVSAGVSYARENEGNSFLVDETTEAAETFGNFSFDFVASESNTQSDIFFEDMSENAESSNDVSMNDVESSSETLSADASGDTSEESSDNVSGDFSEDVSEGSSVDVSSEFSEGIPDDLSADLSADLSDDSSADVSADLSGDSNNDIVYPDDVTVLKNGNKGFVYFQQDSPEYDKLPYGSNTIGSHGCGPVNMAMIISTYTGNVIYPAEAAKWSVDNKCYVKNVGSSHSLMTKMAEAFGVPVSTIPIGSWEKAMQALKDGKYLITRVGDGDFSGGPHFLTIRGITEEGNLLLANSIDRSDSEKAWSQSIVKKNITLSYFWVYG